MISSATHPSPRRPGMVIAEWFRRLGDTPLVLVFGAVVLWAVAWFNRTDLRTDKLDVGLDAQVAVKLVLSSMLGLYGALVFLAEPRVRHLLFSLPGLWMTLVGGLFFLSVPTAIAPVHALGSAIMFACVLLGGVAGLVQFGPVRFLNLAFYGMITFLLGSWVAYLFVPSLGVLDEQLFGNEVAVRMSGIGHPNTLGQAAGMTLVIGGLLYVYHGYRSRFRQGVLCLALVTSVLALSRSSILATLVALLFANRHVFLTRRRVGGGAILLSLGSLGLMLAVVTLDLNEWIESALPFMTKSGDLNELATATGRAEVWSYVMELIAQRPVLGYGPGASKELLEDHHLYAHNLWLHVTLILGLFGGVTVVLMFLGRIVQSFRRPQPLADGILAFICVNGMFENLMFAIVPGLMTLLWLVALLWWPVADGTAGNAPAIPGRIL